MKNALYALFGVLAGFILAGALVFVSRAPAGEPIVLQPAPTEAPFVVQVDGGVLRPGVYKLAEGARVQDAIDAAGGLLTTADISTFNLAEKITDGRQLIIPCKDNACPVETTTLDLPGSDATEVPSDSSGGDTSGADAGASDTELINVNTATLEELETLPGIGPATSKKIIDYRDENGCFSAPEDLLNVSGIGPATLDEIRDLIIAECP